MSLTHHIVGHGIIVQIGGHLILCVRVYVSEIRINNP